MKYTVQLTAGAERDLTSIYEYIYSANGPAAAELVLTRLLDVTERLRTNPTRGNHPRELVAVGVREYRHMIMRPYRVISRMVGSNVYILLIADGRRDMQTLLSQRLLTA